MNRIIVKNLIEKPINNILGHTSLYHNAQWTGMKAYVVPWRDSNSREINPRFPYQSFGGSENL